MAESSPQASAPLHHLLCATYSSPTNASFTHVQKLPAPATEDAKDRTAYLGALRKATAEMQEHINKELTARMEEDKATEAEGLSAKGRKNGAVDEDKEEDNYGEEVVEED